MTGSPRIRTVGRNLSASLHRAWRLRPAAMQKLYCMNAGGLLLLRVLSGHHPDCDTLPSRYRCDTWCDAPCGLARGLRLAAAANEPQGDPSTKSVARYGIGAVRDRIFGLVEQIHDLRVGGLDCV